MGMSAGSRVGCHGVAAACSSIVLLKCREIHMWGRAWVKKVMVEAQSAMPWQHLALASQCDGSSPTCTMAMVKS